MIQPGWAAGTNGTIPYREMDEFCQLAAGVDQSKLLIRTFISSTNKAVRPADVTLTILSAKGAIPVQIGTNWQILNFPHQKELSRENPTIVVNQPKGTMHLALTVEIPIADAPAFPYARLGDGVAEANRMIKAKAGLMSVLAPNAEGVIFFFPKASAGKAKVEIASAAGKREYTADKHGQIKLKLEKKLLAGNPEVKLSEKPNLITPDIE
ncbi:MAG: hypothetical protein JWQ04_411 [Pedosphaera sp.]|nr:hypothetical protein [Pedosphaera sp.]